MKTYRLNIKQNKNPDVIEKLNSGEKIHFVVVGEDDKEIKEWIESIKNINKGEALLSAVISDDIELGDYIIKQYENVGYEQFHLSYSRKRDTFALIIDNKIQPEHLMNDIFKNNGMTKDEFIDSYLASYHSAILQGLIIHTTDFRYIK